MVPDDLLFVILCGSLGIVTSCVVRSVRFCCWLFCGGHSVFHSLGFITRCVVRVVMFRCLFGCVDSYVSLSIRLCGSLCFFVRFVVW